MDGLLLRRADRLARRLKTSRSGLVQRALEQVLAKEGG
jgi:hypothetical protein